MSGKTDVQFFYVVVTTNENPGSNQSLASVRVLFDGGTDRLPPCRTGANMFYTVAIRFRMRANTFCALQYDFVCVQIRFTPCNTISYVCKHVLHRCSKRFRGRNDRYIAAANDSEGRTGFYIIATRHNSYITCGYVA